MTAKTKAAEAPEKQPTPPPIIDKRVLELTPPDGGLAVDIPNDVLVKAGVLGTEYPWAKGYSPEVRAVPYARIDTSPLNHRTIFAKIDELGVSLQQEGLRNPVLGRPSPKDPTRIELVTGERRLRAMGRLNQLASEHGLAVDPWTAVPMRIRQLTDAEVIIEQAIENLDREDPHPLEEAMIYEKLCAPLHEGGQGYTVEQAAAKTRRDAAHIVQSMKLLALREKSREAFLKGEILLGHAHVLCRIPKPDKGPDLQDEMLKDILIGRDGRARPEDAAVMTVAAAKRHAMQHYMLPIAKAPFDTSDPTLNPKQGACAGCDYNTDKQPLLFADVGRSEGLCTKPDCWEAKMDAAWAREKEAAKKNGQKVLTDAEAKAVFPYAHSHDYLDPSKGYVKLDATSYEVSGGATYRSLIKKANVEMPPIVLARTPQKQRVELISKADAEKVIRTLRKEKAETSGPSPDQQHRKAQAAAKEKSRVANLVFQAIVAAIVVAFEKVKDPTDAVLRMLARALVRSVWADTQEAVVKRRDLLTKAEPAPAGKKAAKRSGKNPLMAKHQNNEALLLAHVDKLTGKGPLLAFVLEVTLTRAGGGRPLEDTPEIAEVCTQLKVDAKTIKTTVEAAEKKGKAKPAPKSKATAKKQASKPAKKGEPKRAAKASGKPKAAPAAEDDDEAPPREKRRGGPEKCPRPCTECKAGGHHFSEAMVESEETSPDHEAVKAGVQFWYECKHCDAWLEWDPDEGEDAEPVGGKCRVCGCTDETPCGVEDGECTWNDAEATLCSACAVLLDKTTDFCEPVETKTRKGHPLGRAPLIECLRKEAFAMWAGELYEDLSDADRKSAAKVYPDERMRAVIDEAVQLGRLVERDGGYLLGPSAPARIHELFGPPQISEGAMVAGARIPPGTTTAQGVADAINAESPTHTARVVPGSVTAASGSPMAQAVVALDERKRGAASVTITPPFDVSPTARRCEACKTKPAAQNDDVCAEDRLLIEEVLRVIWERVFAEETPLTEEQIVAHRSLDAGPMRIKGAIAYLRGKELLGLVERQRLVLTPLPPPPPRTKADRDLDLRVLQLLGKNHDSAFKIVRALSTGSTIAGPTHEQVMGSLRYITASDGRFPVMDVALAGVALENTLAETKPEPGSREERLDRALRAELTTGDKDMEVLLHVGARSLGYVTAAPAILPVEIRASCRRLMAERRERAEQETFRLTQPKDPEVPAAAGMPVCFVCMAELGPGRAARAIDRCESCDALCVRVLACIRENPGRWSKNGLSPEAFADVEADGMTPDPAAIVKPHLLRRALEHLVERGEIDTSKGGMRVHGAEDAKRPRDGGAATWRELIGPSKVERLVLQRLHASGHHRVLVIGAHTYRTAAILNHQTAPRHEPIFVDERDEKTRTEGIPPLGVEPLVKGASTSFDRVLVLPSPKGDPAAYDEVPTIQKAYLTLAMETGRIVAVVTKETAADPRIKALLIEHNGVAEELQDDERHLGTGLMLVAIYRVTVAGGVAQRRGKLTGLPGGKAAVPAASKPARASKAKPATKGAGRAKPAAPSGPPGAA